MDALIESRSKMKATQRPALPEEEVFVTESANVLLDYAKLHSAKTAAN
jgi:carboxyl-terminal processing protease